MSRPVAGIVCCTRTVGVEAAQAVIHRYIEGPLRYADCAALTAASASSSRAAVIG